MVQNKETIISEIMDHMNECCPNGTPFKKLYVGISADAEDRLFNGHSVNRETDIWIYRIASSDEVAREIEKHFLDMGFDGGKGGGDNDSNMVYCFLQNAHTKR